MDDSGVKMVEVKSTGNAPRVLNPHKRVVVTTVNKVPLVFDPQKRDELACTTVFDRETFIGLNFKDKVHSLRRTIRTDPWIPDESVIAEARAAAVMESKHLVDTSHHMSISMKHLAARLDGAPVNLDVSVVYRSVLAHVLPQRNNRLVQYPVGQKPTTAGFIAMRDILGPLGLIQDLVHIAWEYSPDLPIHKPCVELFLAGTCDYGEGARWRDAANVWNTLDQPPAGYMAFFIADLIQGCMMQVPGEVVPRHFWYGVSTYQSPAIGKNTIDLITVAGEFSHLDDRAHLYICPACAWYMYVEWEDDINLEYHHPWCPGMGGVAYGSGVMSPYFEPPRMAEVKAALMNMDSFEEYIFAPLIECLHIAPEIQVSGK